MPPRLALASVLALALATPAAAQQDSASDFRLPPSPTPTAGPRPQGPADTDGPLRVAPRVIGTPTPTPAPSSVASPAAPSATATPSAAPTRPAARPAATATPLARPPRAAPAQASNGANVPQGTEASPPAPANTAAGQPSGLPQPLPQPVATDTSASAPSSPYPALTGLFAPAGLLPWLAGLAGLIAAIAALLWALRRRKTARAATAAGTIELPLTAVAEAEDGSAAQAPASAAARDLADVLRLDANAVSLSRSMLNATLASELRLVNRGAQTLANLAVSADITTAHGKVPVGEQLADAATPLIPLARIEALAPGASYDLSGNLQLPVSAIRPITQGQAVLYVPLLRIRIEAEGFAPLVRTFVVGVLPAGTSERLQPFRLNEMAQTYRQIGCRALG